jgi:hypothetical protein
LKLDTQLRFPYPPSHKKELLITSLAKASASKTNAGAVAFRQAGFQKWKPLFFVPARALKK